MHYATLLADSGRLVDSSRSKQQTAENAKPMVVVIGAGGVVPGFEAGIRHMTLGALGCALSHTKVWKQCDEANADGRVAACVDAVHFGKCLHMSLYVTLQVHSGE